MARAEGVVFALLALEKTADAARLFQGCKAISSASEDFVRICLMANIPDDWLARRVEGGKQGNRHLNDAEIWREVAAVALHDLNQECTHIGRQLDALIRCQRSDIIRAVDP